MPAVDAKEPEDATDGGADLNVFKDSARMEAMSVLYDGDGTHPRCIESGRGGESVFSGVFEWVLGSTPRRLPSSLFLCPGPPAIYVSVFSSVRIDGCAHTFEVQNRSFKWKPL